MTMTINGIDDVRVVTELAITGVRRNACRPDSHRPNHVEDVVDIEVSYDGEPTQRHGVPISQYAQACVEPPAPRSDLTLAHWRVYYETRQNAPAFRRAAEDYGLTLPPARPVAY